MNQPLKSVLEKYHQTHLIRFWDELDSQQRSSRESQLQAIDFELMDHLFRTQEGSQIWGELAARAEAPPAITLADFANPESFDRAYQIGSEALSSGKVAMILVAGGQGSRLGFDHPKGMFEIGPISHRSLYQILIEHLRARGKQFKTAIPLYVMTSPPTHEETSHFLAAHERFGLAESDLQIFCQGTMPAMDFEGRLLLASKHQLFLSPDGHGGTVAALKHSGSLDDLRHRGIEYVFYAQVDNPLVQICDPALIGYHILHRSEMTSQVIRKKNPQEKVGNVVTVDGSVRIIEYSDLPSEFAEQVDQDGALKLWAGSIAVHVFDTDFLVRSAEDPDSLPFHLAKKKVNHLDCDGNLVQPTEPNAIKFERFIFDLLPSAKNAIVCEVDPADGFCAVKNAPPAESETPEHVRKAIVDLHRRWLIEAGAIVADGINVEINPLYAVDANQLKQVLPTGIKVVEPTYFAPKD